MSGLVRFSQIRRWFSYGLGWGCGDKYDSWLMQIFLNNYLFKAENIPQIIFLKTEYSLIIKMIKILLNNYLFKAENISQNLFLKAEYFLTIKMVQIILNDYIR